MSWNPSDSAIRMTPEREKQLQTASPDEMKVLFREWAVEDHLVERDIFNPDILLPTELADHAPKKVAKTVVVNGTKTILEADSPEGLVAKENQLLREVFEAAGRANSETNPADEPETTETDSVPARDPATGQFLSQSDAEQLHNLLAEKQSREWAEAVDTFRARHPEWIGGEANKNLFGEILVQNNLTDASDKLTALEEVYQYAVENNLLVENPEVRAAQDLNEKIMECETAQELQNMLTQGRSSGLLGR